jgi:hypothetical protein
MERSLRSRHRGVASFRLTIFYGEEVHIEHSKDVMPILGRSVL